MAAVVRLAEAVVLHAQHTATSHVHCGSGSASLTEWVSRFMADFRPGWGKGGELRCETLLDLRKKARRVSPSLS
jgi:hypothetical protein